MADEKIISATISAGKVGTRFFWVVLPREQVYELDDSAVAEGFEPTSEEAWDAASNAALKLGFEFSKHWARTATSYYKHFRSNGRKSVKNQTKAPEIAVFLGSPYLWTNSIGEVMGEDYDDWYRHVITKVTSKFVFVLDDRGSLEGEPDLKRQEPMWEKYNRLDRAALERDGCASSSGRWTSDDYYTDAGKAARIEEKAEQRRKQAVAQAEADERNRLFLQANPCAYCGGPADRFAMVSYKACCKGCYDIRKARMTGPLINTADW